MRNPPGYQREYMRAWRRRHRDRLQTKQVEARRLNPEKFRARGAVADAKRYGRIESKPCEVCGNPDTQAHHDDYSKPLAVRWLCVEHHNKEHK